MGITPSNNPGKDREKLPYMVLEFPSITLYGHWATPLVLEYKYRVREYCVIILLKYLIYSDNHSIHQS